MPDLNQTPRPCPAQAQKSARTKPDRQSVAAMSTIAEAGFDAWAFLLSQASHNAHYLVEGILGIFVLFLLFKKSYKVKETPEALTHEVRGPTRCAPDLENILLASNLDYLYHFNCVSLKPPYFSSEWWSDRRETRSGAIESNFAGSASTLNWPRNLSPVLFRSLLYVYVLWLKFPCAGTKFEVLFAHRRLFVDHGT